MQHKKTTYIKLVSKLISLNSLLLDKVIGIGWVGAGWWWVFGVGLKDYMNSPSSNSWSSIRFDIGNLGLVGN